MGTFMPGARIGQVHGTSHPADPETGARDALVFAMYHPAAALRTPALERESFEDVARIPGVLLRSRELKTEHAGAATRATPAEPETPTEPETTTEPETPMPATGPAIPAPAPAAASMVPPVADPAADEASQLTLF
jgi:hypothetical protein